MKTKYHVFNKDDPWREVIDDYVQRKVEEYGDMEFGDLDLPAFEEFITRPINAEVFGNLASDLRFYEEQGENINKLYKDIDDWIEDQHIDYMSECEFIIDSEV